MNNATWPFRAMILIALSVFSGGLARADSDKSTRIVGPDQHARYDPGGYPYRKKSEYVLRELDLKPGDVVVDIGAGDGWWAERMAKFVGNEGIVYAAEVDQNDIRKMKKKFANVSQIKPYLCQTDDVGLPADSCDLAFLSQTYHHLDSKGRIEYLRRLRTAVKSTGRVCIVERYANIGDRHEKHGTPLSRVIREAEQGGWVPVRCELISGTQYYIVILVQKDLFGAREPPVGEFRGATKLDELLATLVGAMSGFG